MGSRSGSLSSAMIDEAQLLGSDVDAPEDVDNGTNEIV